MLDGTVKQRSEEIKTWFDVRSHEEGLVIAVRSSMRALPVFWNWAMSSAEAERWDVSPLPPLWANLAAWLVLMRPSEQNKATAQMAGTTCDAVAGRLAGKTQDRDDFGAGNAASAATFAAAHAGKTPFPNPKSIPHLAVLYASSCGGAGARDSNLRFLDAALLDCDAIERGGSVLSDPLWHGGINPMAADWDDLRARHSKSKGSVLTRLFAGIQRNKAQNNNIWLDWYQRAIDGREQPHLEQLEKLSLKIGRP